MPTWILLHENEHQILRLKQNEIPLGLPSCFGCSDRMSMLLTSETRPSSKHFVYYKMLCTDDQEYEIFFVILCKL